MTRLSAADHLPASHRTGLCLALSLLCACAASGAAEDPLTAGAAPTVTTDPAAPVFGEDPPCGRRRVTLDLAVATLPWDPQPPPTDMNGFLLEVADAAILTDPMAASWWEGPADLPLACPLEPNSPVACRVGLGPLDVDGTGAGRPLLVRAQPTSHASPWTTVMTALPAAMVGDGNTVTATIFVMSDRARDELRWRFGVPVDHVEGNGYDGVVERGGVLALMVDGGGQPLPGARLALVDPRLTGRDPKEALAAGLRAPGWGVVDLYYANASFAGETPWTENLVSPAVFATASQVTEAFSLPAAWMAVKDAAVPRTSEIVPLDLVAGNLVILPLVLE